MEEIIQDFKMGKPVIVTDDADRENEGDLIMSAEHMTPEWMAFFIRYTSGIICCALTEQRAKQLGLPHMVAKNEDSHQTAFTVSVDSHDAKTGISAHERCQTAYLLANSNNHLDFKRPGHMFPLIAKPGGVLIRRGHTEAGVDLCKMAGIKPCAILSEITSADCMTMATGEELRVFACTHSIRMTSVDQIAHHLAHVRCE